MPQPNVHMLSTTFQGAIGSTDVWECVLWWQGGEDSDNQLTLAQNMADDADGRFRTLWDNGIGALNAADTGYIQCTARSYNAGSSAAAAEAITGGAVKAGTGSGSGAQSQACCVSLLTNHAGRSGRGRIYLPATAGLHGIDPNHAFSTSEVDNLADAFEAFVTGMQTVVNITPAPFLSVRSLALGQALPVAHIRVDNRPDRQEHRERHLIEYRATRTA